MEKNQQWLNVIIYFDENKEDELQATSSSDKGHMDRPKLQFVQCNERAKRRRTEDIRSQSSIKELSYAAHMNKFLFPKIIALLTSLTSFYAFSTDSISSFSMSSDSLGFDTDNSTNDEK